MDENGVVNALDFPSWYIDYKKGGTSIEISRGDMNQNNIVNALDFPSWYIEYKKQ